MREEQFSLICGSVGHTIFNGERPLQYLAIGLLMYRLCVALLHRLGAPDHKIKVVIFKKLYISLRFFFAVFERILLFLIKAINV